MPQRLSRKDFSTPNAGIACPTRGDEDRLKRGKIDKMMGDLSRLPITREEKVQEIRRLILEQRYESDKKLEIAISRLLDDIDD